MKDLIIYALIPVLTVVIEKLLDRWVKHSKSTNNKLDDLVSEAFRDGFKKLKSIINLKNKLWKKKF